MRTTRPAAAMATRGGHAKRLCSNINNNTNSGLVDEPKSSGCAVRWSSRLNTNELQLDRCRPQLTPMCVSSTTIRVASVLAAQCCTGWHWVQSNCCGAEQRLRLRVCDVLIAIPLQLSSSSSPLTPLPCSSSYGAASARPRAPAALCTSVTWSPSPPNPAPPAQPERRAAPDRHHLAKRPAWRCAVSAAAVAAAGRSHAAARLSPGRCCRCPHCCAWAPAAARAPPPGCGAGPAG